eukprot:37474-Prorocentrum_minimum.AAC.1
MSARKAGGYLTICEYAGSAPQGLTKEITEAGQEEPMMDDTVSLSGPAGSAGSKREIEDGGRRHRRDSRERLGGAHPPDQQASASLHRGESPAGEGKGN